MESLILVIKWTTKPAFAESNLCLLLERIFGKWKNKHLEFVPQKFTELPQSFQLFWGKERFRIKTTIQKSAKHHPWNYHSHLSLI